MQVMVNNKGYVSEKGLKVRKQIKLIVNSLLAPCIEPAEGSDVPFNAQVIIANPPAYGNLPLNSLVLINALEAMVLQLFRIWMF